MGTLNESHPCLTPEQRQEVFNIGREFAFEPGLEWKKYKRQFPEVPEEEEKSAFLDGFAEGKRITAENEIDNGFNQGFGHRM